MALIGQRNRLFIGRRIGEGRVVVDTFRVRQSLLDASITLLLTKVPRLF